MKQRNEKSSTTFETHCRWNINGKIDVYGVHNRLGNKLNLNKIFVLIRNIGLEYKDRRIMRNLYEERLGAIENEGYEKESAIK